jgi:deazaflavin-dependent oxidoreductase (nitroreductase family)
MPLPRGLARFNLVVTNRVTGRFAGRLPGFGIVVHIGRKSGIERRSPVNVFRDGERYVLALTYGRDAQWVRNVMAAGGCELITRGRRIRLQEPELVHDPSRLLVPRPVAAILGALDVEDFLVARA